jgi:hypothetical protein
MVPAGGVHRAVAAFAVVEAIPDSGDAGKAQCDPQH